MFISFRRRGFHMVQSVHRDPTRSDGSYSSNRRRK
jgi:hypothetical protein